MSSVVNTVPSLDIEEVARLIETVGEHVTFIVLSEPGVGKTSLLTLQAIRNSDQWRKPGDYFPTDKYQYVYVDGGTLRENDLAMYMPDRDNKRVEQYVTNLINWDDSRPVVLMFDEVLKIPKLLKPLVTRALLERYIGDRPLPLHSKIFGTSNNGNEGLNDTIEAHVGNRVGIIQMRKANHKRWLLWAAENGISPMTRAFAALYPSMFASYRDGDQSNNPDIYNPRSSNVSFASLRSIAKNDHVVRNWQLLGDTVARAASCGIIGQSAGEKLAAFMNLQSDAVAPAAILKDPEGVPMPDKPAALFMSVFNLLDAVETQDDMTATMKFIQRSSSRELQSIFVAMTLQGSGALKKLAKNNALVGSFIQQNPELLHDGE